MYGEGSTTIPKGSREFTNYLFSKRQTVKQWKYAKDFVTTEDIV